MAHFAKLGAGNMVEQVIVVSNDVATTEEAGVKFINELYKTKNVWKQTSFNTEAGQHKLGGTPFRKNFAGIGFYYDEDLDAFIYPSPFPSWILNTETCIYEAPVKRPNDNNDYNWNENTKSWDLNE
jgi:hypothetical protein